MSKQPTSNDIRWHFRSFCDFIYQLNVQPTDPCKLFSGQRITQMVNSVTITSSKPKPAVICVRDTCPNDRETHSKLIILK